MPDPVELELQLRITDEGKYEELLAHPFFGQAVRRVAFETTYYDTAQRLLQQNGFAYRIRKSANGYTATVKNRGTDGGGLFTRNEWNRAVDSDAPCAGVFLDLPVGKLLADIVGRHEMVPIFTTIVNRASAMYSPEEGCEIELSADIGEIICQGKSEEICEIELELKKGPVRCIFETAEKLAAVCPLLPEEYSKYLRGLRLAGLDSNADKVAAAQKKLYFNKHADYRSVSVLLLDQLDAVIKAQGEYLRFVCSVGGIHRLRIAVRTFRSLLHLLNPFFREEAYKTMQDEFSAYIQKFSRIRDLDVAIKKLDTHRLAEPEAAGDTDKFLKWLRDWRAEEGNSLYLDLSAGQATSMLMRAKVFLLQLGEGQGAVREGKIYSAVCSRYEKKFKKFKKKFIKTDFFDLKAAHALRIRCKKLNYSQQFLKAGRKSGSRKEKKLIELQKVLGRMCDIGSMMRIADEYTAQSQESAPESFIRRLAEDRERLAKEVTRLQP